MNINKIILTCIMMTLGSIGIQASMGSSSSTYAPQIFTPATQYNDDGMIGNYFASNQIATIHNPTIMGENGYIFTDVETGGINAPEGKTKIGSYTRSAPKANYGKPRHGGVMMINLYGIEQQ